MISEIYTVVGGVFCVLSAFGLGITVAHSRNGYVKITDCKESTREMFVEINKIKQDTNEIKESLGFIKGKLNI